MWNEFMEWEDDRDPITFYDLDEFDAIERGENPQWESSQPQKKDENNPATNAIILAAALPIAVAGYFIANRVVVPLVNKIVDRKEKNAEQTHETTEWIRANIKDQQQETKKTVQGDGLYWETRRRKTDS